MHLLGEKTIRRLASFKYDQDVGKPTSRGNLLTHDGLSSGELKSPYAMPRKLPSFDDDNASKLEKTIILEDTHEKRYLESLLSVPSKEAVSLSDSCAELESLDHGHEDFMADLDEDFWDAVDVAHSSPANTSPEPSIASGEPPKLQWSQPVMYSPERLPLPRQQWDTKVHCLPETRSSPTMLPPARPQFSSTPQEVQAPAREDVSVLLSLSAKAKITEVENIRPISQRPPVKPPIKPFVRSHSTKVIPEHSPIHGISNSTRLITCFRAADVLKAWPLAQGALQDIIIEFYACATHCDRDADKHRFIFADIFFPTSGPFFQGTWIGWQGNGSWAVDSNAFLKANNKLCRVVARPRVDAKKPRDLVVQSVMESSWECIEHVRRIVCG